MPYLLPYKDLCILLSKFRDLARSLKYNDHVANIPIFSATGPANPVRFYSASGGKDRDLVWRVACFSHSSETHPVGKRAC